MSAETITLEKRILSTVAHWKRQGRFLEKQAKEEIQQRGNTRAKRLRREAQIYLTCAREIERTLAVAEALWNDESSESQMLTKLELALTGPTNHP